MLIASAVCLLTACGTLNIPVGTRVNAQPLEPVLLGQEHYTLRAFQTDNPDPLPHYILNGRNYDIGLRRDLYKRGSEWQYGGWYLISWIDYADALSAPFASFNRFLFVGTGTVSGSLDPTAFNSLTGDQHIRNGERSLADVHFEFSGISAALAELSALGYGARAAVGTAVVTVRFSGTVWDTGQPFSGTQLLHLARRDGIDPSDFTVYTPNPLQPDPLPALPRWDKNYYGGDIP